MEMGHARALLALPAAQQAATAARVVNGNLSVRETERLVFTLLNPAKRAGAARGAHRPRCRHRAARDRARGKAGREGAHRRRARRAPASWSSATRASSSSTGSSPDCATSKWLDAIEVVLSGICCVALNGRATAIGRAARRRARLRARIDARNRDAALGCTASRVGDRRRHASATTAQPLRCSARSTTLRFTPSRRSQAAATIAARSSLGKARERHREARRRCMAAMPHGGHHDRTASHAQRGLRWRTCAPGANGEIVWRFIRAGAFELRVPRPRPLRSRQVGSARKENGGRRGPPSARRACVSRAASASCRRRTPRTCPGASMLSVFTTPSSTSIEKRWQRTPMPRAVEVELEAERLRVVGAAVAHHAHLAAGLLVARPRAHHERVVDRHAQDLVDALGLQLVVVGEVGRHVLGRARRRERAGQAEDDDLLALA